MMIDKLNLNHLRIFECVYRFRNMTSAARELHLTQSGISQHMKALETALGVKLFDRVRHQLLPTSEATRLYDVCIRSLHSLEETLLSITGRTKELSGTVSIGTPPEFGTNLLIPLISKFSAIHPSVEFKLEVGLAQSMNEKLLTGIVDFAFMDEVQLDPALEAVKVYDEVFELCGHQKLVKKFGVEKNERKYYEAFPFVAYAEGEPFLRRWFSHHLVKSKLSLNVVATSQDVQSVSRFIAEGLGVGVLPGHLIQLLNKRGLNLHCFKGKGKPINNGISLAYPRGRHLSVAAHSAIEYFKTKI